MKLIDPVAQSFYVDKRSGIFVTSIDLFFFSKDSELPVTVQLRPMKLGYPSEVIYPYSEVTLDSFQVNVSNDASVPTRFTFDAPIYLAGEQYHSIIVTSLSDSYSVYISRLGEQNFVSAGATITGLDAVVVKQPSSGSLFKSQNALTWASSDFEDLKFRLYRANFVSNGNINFYNPALDKGNGQIAKLTSDSLKTISNVVRIGIGTTVNDSGLTLGNTILQHDSTGKGKYIGSKGPANGTLSLINAGIGYTPQSGSFTYTNVSLKSVSGTGRNATANITVTNGKIVSLGATIVNGGTGYAVGDVLSASQIGINSLGRNLQLSVSSISGINELLLDSVEGEFKVGAANSIKYINNSGITTYLNNGGVNISSDGLQVESDGLHIRVNHLNHGMHSLTNTMSISGAISNIAPTKITTNYTSSSSSDLLVEDSTSFSTFEGVGIGTSNPGYALIDNEIISYSGVSGNLLTGITRQIDQTKAFDYSAGTLIYKYELSGVSLRRVNTSHDFSDVSVTNPIGLDFYHVKIDASSGGKTESLPYGQVDRSVETSGFPKLRFNQTKSTGGSNIYATQNIQFEIARPIVQTLIPRGTNINASIRTVTGSSISGNEASFNDSGFKSINLDANNYFESPRLICSKVNESTKLTNLPGKKSLTMAVNLSTTDSYISPLIDLERVGLGLISNRIDSQITDYVSDGRVSSLDEDPSAFTYATKPVNLEKSATSLKVYVTSHINLYNDLRCLYAISNDPNEEFVYSLFPGYSNLNSSGQVIDFSQNNGLADTKYEKTSTVGFSANQIPYREYVYTIDNLSPFKYFSIKFIGTSTNQAYPPRLQNLRVIALE